MRLDLALKHSGLIKRRTVAKLYCERGLVKVNDKVGKPSTEVKDQDVIEVRLGKKIIKFAITITVEGKRILLSYELLEETKITDA